MSHLQYNLPAINMMHSISVQGKPYKTMQKQSTIFFPRKHFILFCLQLRLSNTRTHIDNMKLQEVIIPKQH